MEPQHQEQITEQAAAAPDPEKALEQVLTLLNSKDDTQRFVGLALLKAMLDNNTNLQKDTNILARCWNAIPSIFLDRLFRAQLNSSEDNGEAKSMFELAVSVVHAFVVLLPQEKLYTLLPPDMPKRVKQSWIKRIETMVVGFPERSPETGLQVLQILYTFSCTFEGASLFVEVQDWAPLLKQAPQERLIRDTFINTYYVLAQSAPQGASVSGATVSRSLDRNFDILVSAFEDAATPEVFFTLVTGILVTLPPECHPTSITWVERITEQMHESIVLRRPSPAGKTLRETVVLLAAALLRVYPMQCPSLLFNPHVRQDSPCESKPLSYLFIKLILVDIRATIPSLLELLHSADYQTTSSRLAASYDIVSCFTGFLVRSLEEYDDEESAEYDTQETQRSSLLPPDLLLQLRVDISQTMSFTIEYLRDRYDASVGGAPGLHPLGRVEPPLGTGTPAAIAWETSEGMTKDPLTLSQVRAFALWIRDDEGEALRQEAAGIMDVLLRIYGAEDNSEFTYPVAVALEGICATSEGVHAFLSEGGWDILTKDLRRIASSGTNDMADQHGMQIIRVLLTILDSDETGPTKADWMPTLEIIASMDIADLSRTELMLALLDLGYELLAKASPGLRRRYEMEAEKVLFKAKGLFDKASDRDMKERVRDVMVALTTVVPLP